MIWSPGTSDESLSKYWNELREQRQLRNLKTRQEWFLWFHGWGFFDPYSLGWFCPPALQEDTWYSNLLCSLIRICDPTKTKLNSPILIVILAICKHMSLLQFAQIIIKSRSNKQLEKGSNQMMTCTGMTRLDTWRFLTYRSIKRKAMDRWEDLGLFQGFLNK